MNDQEHFGWREVLKGMPAYLADGCRGVYKYWRNAPLREWVAETIWLAILVAMIYYGVYGTIEFFSTTTINPHSSLGWFVSFLPLWFVFAIFIVHWAFSSLVATVFKWMDNRG